MQYIMTDRKGKQSGMLEYAINDVVKSDGGITADINSRFADDHIFPTGRACGGVIKPNAD